MPPTVVHQDNTEQAALRAASWDSQSDCPRAYSALGSQTLWNADRIA